MSGTVSKKRRRNDESKKLIGELQAQSEMMCQNIYKIVEYLQITEMRIKKLEDILNQNCEDINQLKSSVPYKSPEFNTMPYIPWARKETSSPLPDDGSFDIDQIDLDAAEKEMDSLQEHEESSFCMSPLDLTEPSLFCDEVMDFE